MSAAPAVAAVGMAIAAASSSIGGSDLASVLIPGVCGIVSATIGYFAYVRRRDAPKPEDISVTTRLITVETNLSSFRTEVDGKWSEIMRRLDSIEEHVRPWPKDKT